MAEEEQRKRWNWQVPGFEPWKSLEHDDDRRPSPPEPLVRRYSISPLSILPHSELSKRVLAPKLRRLKDKVNLVREDHFELRQQACKLQEYSHENFDWVMQYLGVLADKTHKSDQAALETEARISLLINEKKRLFNELLTAKGNINVFCRIRPIFEDEGPSVVEFPDDFTIRITTSNDNVTDQKDFEFDRVYGPHVGQAEFFGDVQPFVQSALDGYNVSVFAYGQTRSGKTHTMEGPSFDCGLYARCFEELFNLSNSDTMSTSRFNFSATVFEICNEQIRDLLSESRNSLPKIHMGSNSFVDLAQEGVENPLDFSRVLKVAFQNRGTDFWKLNFSHLIVTVHIYYNNLITGEKSYSKISLVDLAGSVSLPVEDDVGEHTTDLLHAMKSLSVLGDVLDSLTSKKDTVPYENSLLTEVLADSLGGSSKTLMIVHVCPDLSNLSETISSLYFSAKVRNAVLSLGNQDTIKRCWDAANDARKELYEKEREIEDLKRDVLALKQALKDTNDHCVLLFNEVQKAWKVSFTLQSDLQLENIMLAEKHKIEENQNSQLKNQVAQLLQVEQDLKLQMQQRESTFKTWQVKLKSIESQLNKSIHARELSSVARYVAQPISKGADDGLDSVAAVTKKLEEELVKRDALIEAGSLGFAEDRSADMIIHHLSHLCSTTTHSRLKRNFLASS